jgi:hypothetical protein
MGKWDDLGPAPRDLERANAHARRVRARVRHWRRFLPRWGR